jgi:molybdopterin molybdotransferase
VDHLHPALSALGAEYLANTVAVRPGFPMLLARVAGTDAAGIAGADAAGTDAAGTDARRIAGTDAGRDRFVAGLPGNPQSAVVALVSLVAPLLAGLAGHDRPASRLVELGADIPGRGEFTHLALVRLDGAGVAFPLPHAGSAMLRGLARADGFAVIEPGTDGRKGAAVPFAPLPLLTGVRR